MQFPVLDDLDRRVVIALQSYGRASWRAIAEGVGASTATVARHGQALFNSGLIRVGVQAALGSEGQYDAFIIRINTSPGMQLQVASQLADIPEMRFVTVVSGRHDIVAELIVHGGAMQYPKLVESLQAVPGVERWRSDLVLNVYKVSFDWARQLINEPTVGDEPPLANEIMHGPQPCFPSHFDEADLRIVDALREDGRESFNAIADDLGMNESSVRRRFERLRKNGCINILTLVPAAALGMGAETILTIKVKPAAIDRVAEEIGQHPAVRFLAATLDQNALFCEVILPSTAELYKFLTRTLSLIDGVEGWDASMELLYLKRGFIHTPWWRAQVGYPSIGEVAHG